MPGQPLVFRGTILHFKADPGDDLEPSPDKMELFVDGALVIDGDGAVVSVGPWDSSYDLRYPNQTVDYRGKLIVPGFVDTHVHYVQMDAIASHGGQILQWLDKYILPAESKFDDYHHASNVASFFLDTLLACGITTAMVWSSTPKESVDAFFTQAQARGMRMLTGKVVQDQAEFGGNQNDPNVEAAEKATRALIHRWHGVDRLLYAVTPRFAPTCSPEMLDMCRRLLEEFQTRDNPLWFQTHLSENAEEERLVREKFGSGSYAEVYDGYRLFRPRSVFAHCNEITAADRALMAAGGASIAHCPTSNFFLGSGTFNLWEAAQAGIRVGLGSDCGAGTRYDMLSTMGGAYKAQAMAARDTPYPKPTAWQGFYLATRGGAAALHLDLPLPGNPGIGWFAPGNEADFVVLDLAATPVIKRRIDAVEPKTSPRPSSGRLPQKRSLLDMWHEKLFALMTMGDDRATYATYVMGRLSYFRDTSPVM